MKTQERKVKVFEVLYDAGGYGGAAGDGTIVERFDNRRDAESFAVSARGPYGGTAKVIEVDVPKSLARRWGLA